MKLLITGSGGQLGKEWVDFCYAENILFKDYKSNELDILDFKKVREIIEVQKPDIIINCAAYTNVDDAESNSEKAHKINSAAVKNIAQVCAQYNIKLVHFSTDYIFSGRSEDQKKHPDGYSENHVADPVNEYGNSKYLGEKELFNSECVHLLIRVSWLCGKYGHNFVKTMLKLGSEKEELNVVNDQFGAPTFAEQVVEQTFELLQQKKTGIYHLSSGGVTTWYHFSKEIFNQKGIKVKVNPVTSAEFPTKAERPSFSKLSTQKISNIDGIEIIHWKEGLQRLLKQLT